MKTKFSKTAILDTLRELASGAQRSDVGVNSGIKEPTGKTGHKDST